ncbi:MAG: Na+/H+ antiporter NhaA [Planctomycetota bacterium]|jgi:NhaA family Na+:H+ antiporter
MPTRTVELPRGIADTATAVFMQFLRFNTSAGVALIVATCIALGLSNSPWSEPYLQFWEVPLGFHYGAVDFTRSLRHWINDGLMTLFFFVIALELKRGVVLGELRNLRVAAFSLFGALGGMLFPVFIFLVVMRDHPGAEGWGVVMATDTAFLIGGVALFGQRIPGSLRLFLVSLAIFDDVGAILVVAIGYGAAPEWTALAAAGVGVAVVYVLARIGIRSIPVYVLFGISIWVCFDSSGIHPTLAGVILGLMTPTRAWVSDKRLRVILHRVLSYPKGEHWSGDTDDRGELLQAGRATRESLSPVERLEIGLQPWVGFVVLPLFALANAGVRLFDTNVFSTLTIAIVAGLSIGKPIGIMTFAWVSVRLRLASRPADASWSLLAGGSVLTGIGFTMSIFIADLAYSTQTLSIAKVGILCAAVLSSAVGLSMLLWTTRTRRTPNAQRDQSSV